MESLVAAKESEELGDAAVAKGVGVFAYGTGVQVLVSLDCIKRNVWK